MERLIHRDAGEVSMNQSNPENVAAPKKRRGRPKKTKVEPNFTMLGHGDTLIKLDMPESAIPPGSRPSKSKAQEGLNQSKQSNNASLKLEETRPGELKRIYLCERGSCGKV